MRNARKCHFSSDDKNNSETTKINGNIIMDASSPLSAFNCTMHESTPFHHSNTEWNDFHWNDPRNIVELFQQLFLHTLATLSVFLFRLQHLVLGSLLNRRFAASPTHRQAEDTNTSTRQLDN